MTFFGTDATMRHPTVGELESVARGNLEPNTGTLERHLRSCPMCFELARQIQDDVHRQCSELMDLP